MINVGKAPYILNLLYLQQI